MQHTKWHVGRQHFSNSFEQNISGHLGTLNFASVDLHLFHQEVVNLFLKCNDPRSNHAKKKTLLNQNQLPDPFRLRKGKAHLSLACRGCLDGCCFRSRTSNVCQLPGQQKRLACVHLMLQWKQLSPSQSLPPVAASRTVCLRDEPIETIRVGPSLKKNPSCQNDCQWWHKAKEKHLNTQDF